MKHRTRIRRKDGIKQRYWVVTKRMNYSFGHRDPDDFEIFDVLVKQKKKEGKNVKIIRSTKDTNLNEGYEEFPFVETFNEVPVKKKNFKMALDLDGEKSYQDLLAKRRALEKKLRMVSELEVNFISNKEMSTRQGEEREQTQDEIDKITGYINYWKPLRKK